MFGPFEFSLASSCGLASDLPAAIKSKTLGVAIHLITPSARRLANMPGPAEMRLG